MKSQINKANIKPKVMSDDSDSIKLTSTKLGVYYKITEIKGGCEVKTRLASMGILPGQDIRVLNPGSFGPTMILIKGSRVALGNGVCHKILVKQNGDNKISSAEI
jgi:ferrous iron transport protein A